MTDIAVTHPQGNVCVVLITLRVLVVKTAVLGIMVMQLTAKIASPAIVTPMEQNVVITDLEVAFASLMWLAIDVTSVHLGHLVSKVGKAVNHVIVVKDPSVKTVI